MSISATRVHRVRHEIKVRQLRVARVEPLGPGVRSVTFSGEALADFVSASFDDHIKFIFPGPDGAPMRRDYTPRRIDIAARELTLEFALHGSGPAAAWAAQAAPGQVVDIAGPRGSMIIPTDYDWHVLAGDASAMPAVVRRLEQLPADARAIVILDVPDPRDRRELHSAASLSLQWVAGSAELIAAVRALALPPGEGFAWCAGEAVASAALRQILVSEKGLPGHAVRASAYWKQGAIAHHENFETEA
jgi:NADPH-dependent ferric siderophore reductase